ncbi:GIY-YIG nuclease family protein [Micromonospora echinospora]|uniref:GIY-YIG nuclease family protein n=1 Tax=Micromonospora echinospora TaxID=1877 RepID=UPI0033D84FA5
MSWPGFCKLRQGAARAHVASGWGQVRVADRARPSARLTERRRHLGVLVNPEDALLRPARLYGAEDVRRRECPIPAVPGVYGWYFASPPSLVPLEGCYRWNGLILLYVGISPKAPPTNGRPPSRQTIRSRIRYHYRGNAAGSTLRLTLGSLLAEDLGIGLRRVGSGNRLTFGRDGEKRLSAWMAEHAQVVWTPAEQPWTLEEELIRSRVLPLNLDQNRNGSFHGQLSALRAAQRAQARLLPVER